MRTHLREFLQRRHHVQRRCIAIGILALRQRPRLLALGAAGEIGEQLEQAVRRGRQRHVLDQDLAQRLAAHGSGMRGAEQRDDLVDEAEIVLGKDAEGIADDIVEAACLEIEVDMPGLLLRSLLVEEAPRHEVRRHRIFAGTAGFGDDRRRGGLLVRTAAADDFAAAAAPCPSSSYSDFSIRAVSLPPGTQRLSRASLLLAIASE